MRSSKSRSRSKANRPRSLGNIVNRVFDSSGPEGKVRGTPQQIIEKYLFLARDAQLSNDRVAAENFLQHAEHYTRMLGEAQREMARDEASRGGGGNDGQNRDQYQGRDQNQNRDQNQSRDQTRDQNQNGNARPWRERESERQGGQQYPDGDRGPRPEQQQQPQRRDDRPQALRPARGAQDQDDFRPAEPREHENRPGAQQGSAEVIDLSGDEAGSTLVETPEARGPKPRRKPRSPKAEGAEAQAPEAAKTETSKPDAPKPDSPKPDAPKTRAPRAAKPADPKAVEAAEKPAVRRTRGPRKPRDDASGNGDESTPKSSAAE